MVTPKILINAYSNIENSLRGAGIISGYGYKYLCAKFDPNSCSRYGTECKSGRHMKFPYTLSAKIAQFPLFYYLKKNWIWMYYPLGILGGFYAFYKFHLMANSEENKRSWAETQRKFAEKEHH